MCGTDLQAARAELSARRATLPHVPGPVPRLGDDAIRIGVTVFARNLMIALLGFSLVGLVAYAQIWGGLFRDLRGAGPTWCGSP